VCEHFHPIIINVNLKVQKNRKCFRYYAKFIKEKSLKTTLTKLSKAVEMFIIKYWLKNAKTYNPSDTYTLIYVTEEQK
jgi:hypothetical protein